MSKGVDGPRVGSGLGIDSLSWKLLFLIIYQQGKIGFRTFWVTTPSRCLSFLASKLHMQQKQTSCWLAIAVGNITVRKVMFTVDWRVHWLVTSIVAVYLSKSNLYLSKDLWCRSPRDWRIDSKSTVFIESRFMEPTFFTLLGIESVTNLHVW